MKAQVTSVLLCALLCSTLGHEYLAAKRLAPEAKSKSALSNFQERAAVQEQCQWVCEGNGGTNGTTGGLQIIVNETTSLIGIVNVTANVALVIDINANLVGLFNGTSGAVIIINVQTGAGVYIASGQCDRVWISSKQSFEVYFKSLTSLQVLVDLKVGTSFKIDSASNTILEIVASLLIKLSGSNASEIQGDVKGSIKVLVRITTVIISSVKSLNGILKLFGRGLIVLYGDIFWFISVFEGFVLFFSKINGGFAALIKAGVELDFALFLRATNGMELLTNLLLRIVARVDLTIVSGILNSVEVLIEVIVKLGGNVSTGVTGIWKIIYGIISVRSGRIKIDVLIRTLIEYSVDARSEVDITVYIKGFLEVIRIQQSRYSSTSITAFITFVQNVQKGKLVIGGINISGIISILVKGAVGGVLVFVVTILLQLTVIVKASEAILGLLLYLLRLLTSGAAGVRLLLLIIPGLSVKVSASGGVSITEIFRGVSLVTILKYIATGFNLNVVLTSVPVFGQIYKALSAAVSSASSGSLSLQVIIKTSGSSSFVTEIKGWLQGIIKIFQQGGGNTEVNVSTVTERNSYNYTYHHWVTWKIGK